MAYNLDELNTVYIYIYIYIWSIYDKVRDDNLAIKFCQRYELLRQTLIVRFTGQYVLQKYNNVYQWICYRKGHQRRPKVCLREESFYKGSHFYFYNFSISVLLGICSIQSFGLSSSVETSKYYKYNNGLKKFTRDLRRTFSEQPLINGGIGHIVEIAKSLVVSQKILCRALGSRAVGVRGDMITRIIRILSSIGATQRRYFIAYHCKIYSSEYGNTFRSVEGLWRITSTTRKL